MLFFSALLLALNTVCAGSGWAQAAQSYELPAQPVDVAISNNGVVVSTLKDTAAVWIRAADGSQRTATYGGDAADVVITEDGSKAYEICRTSPSFYVLEVPTNQASVRSYDGNLAALALSRSEQWVVVGLGDGKVIVTKPPLLEDFASPTLNGVARSLVVSQNAKHVFVATAAALECLLKVNLATGAVVRGAHITGGITNLAISPSGRLLYAVNSSQRTDGSYRHSICTFKAATLARRSRRVFRTNSVLPLCLMWL